MLGLTMLCGLLGVAQAATPEVWAGLHDGRLVASIDRDAGAAVAIYESLLRDLGDDDSLRAELLYWLGRARFNAGDVGGARAALEAASRDAQVHDRARTFLGWVEVRTGAISTLPYREDFDVGTGAWVRGWPGGDVDDLDAVLGDSGDDRMLVWKLEVREGEDDRIILPMTSLNRRPTGLRFLARAKVFPLHLRVQLEDAKGQVYSTAPIKVPAQEWAQVELSTEDFALSFAPQRRAQRLPKDLQGMIFRDVSAFHGEWRGENSLMLDDVELR